MKISLRYRIGNKGRFIKPKCPCCREEMFFTSFKKAREYAQDKGATQLKATRIRPNK